jgi:hypothetical protein
VYFARGKTADKTNILRSDEMFYEVIEIPGYALRKAGIKL